MSGIWWVMSFAEPAPPDGRGWLGGVITEADTLGDAITWTHLSGINPGGEILFTGFRAPAVDMGVVDRLIVDRDEWMGIEPPAGLVVVYAEGHIGERSGD